MSDYIGDLANISKTLGTTTLKNSSKGSVDLKMDDFLKIMVAQFQNQDPENAASTTDMLNQMVQMTTIQAINDITDAAAMLYSSSLVGKEVTVGAYDSDGNLQEIVGTVTGTGTYSGNQVIFVDGVMYSMSSIMAVGRLPATDTDTDVDAGGGTDNDTDVDAGGGVDNDTDIDAGGGVDTDTGADTDAAGGETEDTGV